MAMEKTFDAGAAEPHILQKWLDSKAFAAGANKSRDETFCIMIPPPNVTGSLHMGHAFNNTLQDILVRWHRMRGFDTLWQPGQDHAGIATQMVVEREMAANNEGTRAEMGREKFIERVWQQKEKSGNTIINQLKRLGASCDWDRNAFTMDPNFHDAVIKTFVKMYNEGTIYRGKRLVNWDPHFETAISDLEVENIEVDGHFWHFKYPLANGETYTYVEKDEDGNVTLTEERDYISIATTRPETMLGDGAVAVHPSDERYAPIVGKQVHLPLCERTIPIITDDYPDPDFGSGAVKITGAHDFNDYMVAKRNDIPLYSLMDTKGAMRADAADDNLVPEKYRGMDRFEARKAVVADIDAQGLMIAVEDKQVMQPFGDRSKVVIEPMLTDQWFVDAEKIVGPALDAVRNGETQILPERDKKVYFHWLENIEPWCISRQLWWGHQVPVWYGPGLVLKSTKDKLWKGDDQTLCFSYDMADRTIFCASSFAEARQAAKKYYLEKSIDDYGYNTVTWDPAEETDFEIFERSDFDLRKRTLDKQLVRGEIQLSRDPDVLDTWFSSGLWPLGTLGWPEETDELKKYFPTDVLITGFDIIFFWVARMMMMQYAMVDQKPFSTVYVHALVRDEHGKKMSKSLGNVLDPLELIDEYGADAVRFTLTAMAAMGRDLKLSTARIEGYRNFGTKLWNAARFAEFNECKPMDGFDPKSVTQTLNKWMVGETAKAREAVDAALEQYRYNDAADVLYKHIRGLLCDWYVELSKPLFQGDDAAVRAETQATMAWALDQCLILVHPIMPYITEQLWADIAPRDKMLVHGDWPTYTVADYVDAAADAEMNWVIGLIEQVRSVRSEMNVNAGAKIPMVVLDLDDAGRRALDGNRSMIERLARISEVTEEADAPKGAITLPVEGGTVCLPLADVIDVAAEKARLQKGLDKLAKEIGGLNGKLNNEKFLASAPEAVVTKQRDRLTAASDELATLQAAFDRVAALAD